MKEKIEKFSSFKAGLKQFVMTFLLIIGVPVAISFVLGYEMQAKQIQNISTVIVDHDQSSFSRMLVDEIKNNEIFKVTQYLENDNEVQQYIENDKARVGVIIPSSFSKDLKEGKGPKVLILYDDAQLSITSAAKSRMAEILLTLKTGYLKKVVEGKLNTLPQQSKNAVLPMYFTYRLLNNPTRNYVNFMLPGMLVSVIQVGLAMLGVERIRKEEKYFTGIFAKGILWGILGTISIIITVGIQYKYFGMPYRGTLKGGLILTTLFSMGLIAFGMLIRMIIPNDMFATQVSALLTLPTSLLGGYTFPLMAMPKFFQQLATILPYVHYGDAVRDLCLKPIGIEYIADNIKWMAKFVVIMWVSIFIVFIVKKLLSKAYNKIMAKKEEKQSVEVVT